MEQADSPRELAAKLGVDLPICAMVHEVSTGGTSVTEAIRYLLNRPLKEE